MYVYYKQQQVIEQVQMDMLINYGYTVIATTKKLADLNECYRPWGVG